MMIPADRNRKMMKVFCTSNPREYLGSWNPHDRWIHQYIVASFSAESHFDGYFTTIYHPEALIFRPVHPLIGWS